MSVTSYKYQRIIANYEKHCLRIAQATSININENSVDKHRRVSELEADYINWFEYYLPNYAKKKSGWFHQEIAEEIIGNKQIKAIMEAYRSAGKSVHIDLGIPLYLYLALGELHFMLLVGETEPKAKKLLSGIQAQLQYNKRIINDYGQKFKHGDWGEGDFSTTDGVRFQAIGFGQSPRGAREEADRPDYIVVDDVDSKKHVNNDRLMREAVDYITEDVWGTFDADDDATERFVYANNNFNNNSITNRLKTYITDKIKEFERNNEESNFYHLRVDAVKDLKNFEPNWPEKTSSDYWRKKFASMPYRSFMREFMNTHVEEGKVFKPEWIQYTKILPYRDYDAIVFYGDLSFKDDACHKSIVAVGRKGRQNHILHIMFRQTSRVGVAKWLYDIYEDKNLLNEAIHYLIEGLFAMSEFVNDFDDEGEARGYYIPVVSKTEPKPNKFDRIEAMTGVFERRWMFFNEDEKDQADQILARQTLLAFEKGTKVPLDFLDALEGGLKEISKLTFVQKFDPVIVSRESLHKNRF
jgi:hypothetical protein